ncbi:hypothetical protein [Ramlibacter humi]|uniref:Uncharacterized protein n=1 Tax=Ramlibacter humi TaxID=2530451 RepID=A0A4Z0BW39_9BURK|nr:hypothetical protein [Ramlibacter humi]TFZ03537.1 hypothetical protein EZ216_07645 [Ramlibacter humi]
MPSDTTPDPRDMERMPERQRIPDATRGGEAGKPDIEHRPSLPDHPKQMTADIEDEDDDPVVDSGPGIADGPERQR